MRVPLDIHNYPKQYQQAEAHVRRSKLSEHNKDLIFRFRDACLLQQVCGKVRLIRAFKTLEHAGLILSKDFDQATSVVADINEWRGMSSNTTPDAWVFPSENGKTPLWANNAWYDKIRPTLQKVGLAWVNYQVLRRSAVTLLNATGADGTIVAAQCGHTVDVSTNVYNKVGLERQLQAVEVLDAALRLPIPKAS